MCKDNGARVRSAQITIAINTEPPDFIRAALVAWRCIGAESGRPQGAAANKKPGAIARPGTAREFQFRE